MKESIKKKELNAYDNSNNFNISGSNFYNQYLLTYQKVPQLLIKKGKRLGLKTKRWFILENEKILYFKTERIEMNKPAGIINIESINFVEVRSILKEYQFCLKIELQANKIFYIFQKDLLESNFIKTYFATILFKISPFNISYTLSPNLSDKIEIKQAEKEKNINNSIRSTSAIFSGPSFNQLKPLKINNPNNDNSKNYFKVENMSESSDISELKFPYDDLNYAQPIPISISHRSMENKMETTNRSRKIHLTVPNSNNKLYLPINNYKNFSSNNIKFDEEIDNSSLSDYICDEIDFAEYEQKTIYQLHYENRRYIRPVFGSQIIKTSYFQEPRFQPEKSRNLNMNAIGPKILLTNPSTIINQKAELQSLNSIINTCCDEEIKVNCVNNYKISSEDINDSIPNSAEFSIRQINNIKFTPLKSRHKEIPLESLNIKTREECLQNGMESFWNFQLKNARSYFSLHEDFLCKLLQIECDIYEIALSGIKSDIEKCVAVLTNLYIYIQQKGPIPIKEDINKMFSLELTKAEILLLKGSLYALLGSKFQSFWSLAESWRIYKKLELIDTNKIYKEKIDNENRYRYNFGYGVFNLAFSLIPQHLLRIIKIIGISPNKALGLEKLESLRKSDSVRSIHAGLLVCLHSIEFEINTDYATTVLHECSKRYPNSPIFYWLGSVISWKLSQVNFFNIAF